MQGTHCVRFSIIFFFFFFFFSFFPICFFFPSFFSFFFFLSRLLDSARLGFLLRLVRFFRPGPLLAFAGTVLGIHLGHVRLSDRLLRRSVSGRGRGHGGVSDRSRGIGSDTGSGRGVGGDSDLGFESRVLG